MQTVHVSDVVEEYLVRRDFIKYKVKLKCYIKIQFLTIHNKCCEPK